MKIERVFETTTAAYSQKSKHGRAGWWYYATSGQSFGAGRTRAEAVKELQHNWTCGECAYLRVNGRFRR